MEKERVYIAIDLKSFYASVECVERKLDPLATNLVVADASRTEKTICLAVSPSLKAYGISGRARLFEVIQKVKEVNARRLNAAIQERKAVYSEGKYSFAGSSFSKEALEQDVSLAIDYIVAPPRMAVYLDISAKIYSIYLKYVAPEDIFAYSIDEVFIDATHYLMTYRMNAHDLAMMMIRDVLYTTGITATAGIGTNLYLAKIAMDIVAKHMPANQDGVRVASLDEKSFRELLWDHKPLTDFWRIGRGTANHLNRMGITTIGELARYSLYNEDRLYKEFGIDAELLIDHAWGYEPCEMGYIKSYKPNEHSVCEGQVLSEPYTYDKAKIIVREMLDSLVLQLVQKGLSTDSITIDIGYDRESLADGRYQGDIHIDHYGRAVPKPAHGTAKLASSTNLLSQMLPMVLETYARITDPTLLVRRINLAANRVKQDEGYVQLDLFTDAEKMEKEKKLQQAMLSIKTKYGKNALLKGTNFEEGATMRDRNGQIGGHKA